MNAPLNTLSFDWQAANQQALSQLLSDSPHHKENDTHYTQVLCWACGKHDAYISKDNPYSTQCNHANNCGAVVILKTQYPQFFPSKNNVIKAKFSKEKNHDAIQYLQSRGLDPLKMDFWQWEIKVEETGLIFQTVAFNIAPKNKENGDKGLIFFRFIPYRNANGNLVEPKPKSIFNKGGIINGRVYQTQSTLKGINEVWICEGIFNAESLQQGLNKAAIATLTSKVQPKTFYLNNKDKTFICAFDNDKAGLDSTKKHIKFFKENGINYKVALPEINKDWNDLLKEKMLTNEYLEQSLQRGVEFEKSLEIEQPKKKTVSNPINPSNNNISLPVIFEKAPQASIMANAIRSELKTILFDGDAKVWFSYLKNKWNITNDQTIKSKIADFVEKKVSEGYSSRYIIDVCNVLSYKQFTDSKWDNLKDLIPFKNGVLRLSDKTLLPHSPEHYFTWQLPYDYNPKETCKPIIKFLLESVCGNQDQVQLIRAYMNAIVKGRSDLQKYLEIIGFGGTGKGTLLRLLIALVGDENAVSTDLNNLENNKHETAKLFRKKLVMITDSDKYNGGVSTFKAATGGDKLRYDPKHIQGDGGFVFTGLFIIAANQDVKSNDYSSGMARRRITMRFDNEVKIVNSNLDNDLKPFLSGLMNWVLDMPDKEVDFYLLQTLVAVPSLHTVSHETLINTNPLAGWLDRDIIYDINAKCRIGNKSDNIDEFLYPSYVKYCNDHGMTPMNLNNFSTNLIDLCRKQLSLDVKKSDKTRNGRFILGIRLRTPNDDGLESPLDFKYSQIKKESEQSETQKIIGMAKKMDVDLSKNAAEFFALNYPMINDGREKNELLTAYVDAYRTNGENAAIMLLTDWL